MVGAIVNVEEGCDLEGRRRDKVRQLQCCETGSKAICTWVEYCQGVIM
jgi:hypothetical protein